MSTALATTRNTLGFRTLKGLGAADPDLVAQIIADGYDPGTINTLVAMGVTDDQLENMVLDGTDPATLVNQLGGALPAAGGNAAQAGSYPQSAVPSTISTAWGVYDLTQDSAWMAMLSVLNGVKNDLQAVAVKFPNDADTAQHIQDFNSQVLEFAGYYQEAFGAAPSPIPLASTTGLGRMSGLGVVPLVFVAGVAVAIAAILAAAYAYHQWAQVKLAQIAAPAAAATATAQQTTTATQAALTTQYQGLVAAGQGNSPQAQQLLSTINALAAATPATPGSSLLPTNWTLWFQQNMGLIFAGFAAVIILPPVIKKL